MSADGRSGMHVEITAQLTQAKTLTPVELAARLKADLGAVSSCLLGMRRRGEVVRLSHKPGTWSRYRLGAGMSHD